MRFGSVMCRTMDVSFGVAEHRGDLGCHHAVRDCKNEERVAELHAGWIRLVAILGKEAKLYGCRVLDLEGSQRIRRKRRPLYIC